jgi:hypothetical protein
MMAVTTAVGVLAFDRLAPQRNRLFKEYALLFSVEEKFTGLSRYDRGGFVDQPMVNAHLHRFGIQA